MAAVAVLAIIVVGAGLVYTSYSQVKASVTGVGFAGVNFRQPTIQEALAIIAAFATGQLYACVGPISNCIEGITITVDLTVSNPGFISITLEKVTYSLFICGEFVGQGNTGPISIPAGSSSTVRVTQTISKSSIPNALWQVFANKGLAEISASGQAKVLFLDVPFTYTTQVDVYQKIRDGIMAAIQG